MKVDLQHITKIFDNNRIVNDVTINMQDGEMFFLLGPSGCGKTTILRMLAGFYAPEEGEILFDGKRINEVPPHLRNTALVFQNYAVWPHMSVFENVAYGLRVRKLAEEEIRKQVGEVLDLVRISALADRKPTSLSGGQQQRVALARAIVVNPDILLFDEPLSNLDAKLRLEVRDEIRHLHATRAITSLYVTHDQEEALSLADRIAVMKEGRIHQIGTPMEIYDTPSDPFVASFVGEVNLVEATSPLAKYFALSTGVAAFRPERVVFLKDGGIPVRVEVSTYLGSKSQFILKTEDGQEIKAWSNDYHPVGEQVRFTVPEEFVLRYPEGEK